MHNVEAQQGKSSVDLRSGELKTITGDTVNVSGHVQELERSFSLFNMCAVAIVIGNCWSITGATIILSLYNGGAPGIIYEFIAAGIMYLLVTANLAELASAIPSSAGVYHWASVTPGRRVGRVLGFFAGYWNSLAYAFGGASLAAACAHAILQMWAVTHDSYVYATWQVLVIYLVIIWASAALLIFGNHLLPMVNNIFMVLGFGGWLISVIAVAALPSQGGRSHASSHSVWQDWENNTGYLSNGLVFVLGMFNGVFNIGTPDCSTHMAEEVPRPAVNIPIAMGTQMVSSFVSTVVYIIVVMYAISDFSAILESTAEFPLVDIYLQASGSTAGAVGLTVVVLLPLLGSVIGSMLTASRVFWTLARDEATPFSDVFRTVSPRWKNPVNSVLFIACFCTIMGLIYLGSSVAFDAFVGSFVVLTTLSYLAALLPFLFSKRQSVRAGPFFIKGALGFVINAVSCLFMVVWLVFYCFPYALPVDAEGMNYASLMAGGLTVFIGAWWFCVQGKYKGPHVLLDVRDL
ncbi:amino acid/polyamine transporter I [Xylariales sp. PMI_506]|nr:amino acid/polyamine transporter I [Xylariales sp. PMI_506]